MVWRRYLKMTWRMEKLLATPKMKPLRVVPRSALCRIILPIQTRKAVVARPAAIRSAYSEKGGASEITMLEFCSVILLLESNQSRLPAIVPYAAPLLSVKRAALP